MVESKDAFTPGPAEGLPSTGRATQIVEHPLTLAQVFFLGWSFVNSYRMEPAELTRILPSLVLRTSTVWKRLAREAGRAPANVDRLAAASRLTTRRVQIRFMW